MTTPTERGFYWARMISQFPWAKGKWDEWEVVEVDGRPGNLYGVGDDNQAFDLGGYDEYGPRLFPPGDTTPTDRPAELELLRFALETVLELPAGSDIEALVAAATTSVAERTLRRSAPQRPPPIDATLWVEGCLCLFSTNGVLDNYAYNCPHHAEAAIVCSIAGDGRHVPQSASWNYPTGVECKMCGQGLEAKDLPG